VQTNASTPRQLRFAVFLQSFAALLLLGAGIVRITAMGFDLWAFVFILLGLVAATAAVLIIRAIRRS
jgi:hypothetical protein